MVKTNSPRGRRTASVSRSHRHVAAARRGRRAYSGSLRTAPDAVERLVEAKGQIFPASFSPDSSSIVAFGAAAGAGENDDVVLVSLSGDGAVAGGNREARPLLHTMFRERKIPASLRMVDGWRTNRTSPAAMRYTCVRSCGGWGTLAGVHGRGICNRCGPGTAVSCSTGAATRLWGPCADKLGVCGRQPDTAVQRSICRGSGKGRSYDVSPDGQRFLMIKAGPVAGAQSGSPARIIIVGKWFEELKRLVPTN